ncbi:hypothetical protein L218DRAFT_949151 [Marasmius fiardii PR-910]|nr:hypothetical protein L218DRAFT_949151 [Marasmius fiardii PR-910]
MRAAKWVKRSLVSPHNPERLQVMYYVRSQTLISFILCVKNNGMSRLYGRVAIQCTGTAPGQSGPLARKKNPRYSLGHLLFHRLGYRRPSDPNFWHLAYFCIFGVNEVSEADISSLYGMGVLQVFFYFRWLVETLQVAIFYFSTYSHIIGGFGDITKLLAIECYILGQNIKICTLDDYWDNTVVIQKQLSSHHFCCPEHSKILLRKGKSEIKQTNDMLDTLILYAINRGSLTAACALINLVLFLAIPGKFYFFLGLVCSKLTTSMDRYMNSMLATLNARSYVQETSDFVHQDDTVDWNSILATRNQRFAVPSEPMFPSRGLFTVNEETSELQDMSSKVSGVH